MILVVTARNKLLDLTEFPLLTQCLAFEGLSLGQTTL